MGEEKLILSQDSNWDSERPIPREPWRFGKVAVRDSSFLKKYPKVENFLKRNNFVGAYFDNSVVKQLVKDNSLEFSNDEKAVFDLADALRKEGLVATADIINSLPFKPEIYQSIVKIVHNKLFLSQLGPNKEMVGPVLTFFLNELKKNKTTASKKGLLVYDPFGGGAALSYLLANLLGDSGLGNFTILVGDIDDTGFLETRKLLESRGAKEFLKNSGKIKFVKTDAISMDKIPDSSLDYIMSTLCLHEHSLQKVKTFFFNAVKRLKKGGKIIIVDCTSESKILRRARERLPLLNRVGPLLALTLHFYKLKTLNNVKRAFEELIQGNVYVTLSGIRSYESGLKKEDFEKIISEFGLAQKAKVWYNFTNPIGSIQIEITK